MWICFGWSKVRLNLSPEKRYYPEYVQNLFKNHTLNSKNSSPPSVNLPLWIHMDDQYVRLEGPEQLSLACQLVCLYHNGPDCRAPPDDGWDLDTLESEHKAMQHMLEEATDDETDFEGE